LECWSPSLFMQHFALLKALITTKIIWYLLFIHHAYQKPAFLKQRSLVGHQLILKYLTLRYRLRSLFWSFHLVSVWLVTTTARRTTVLSGCRHQHVLLQNHIRSTPVKLAHHLFCRIHIVTSSIWDLSSTSSLLTTQSSPLKMLRVSGDIWALVHSFCSLARRCSGFIHCHVILVATLLAAGLSISLSTQSVTKFGVGSQYSITLIRNLPGIHSLQLLLPISMCARLLPALGLTSTSSKG